MGWQASSTTGCSRTNNTCGLPRSPNLVFRSLTGRRSGGMALCGHQVWDLNTAATRPAYPPIGYNAGWLAKTSIGLSNHPSLFSVAERRVAVSPAEPSFGQDVRTDAMDMTPETVLQPLPVTAWDGSFAPALCRQATDALEGGKVLVLPLPFATAEDEHDLLSGATLSGKRKNISLDPRTGRLGSAAVAESHQPRLAGMMQRFADSAASLMADAAAGLRPRAGTGPHQLSPGRDRRAQLHAAARRPAAARRCLPHPAAAWTAHPATVHQRRPGWRPARLACR